MTARVLALLVLASGIAGAAPKRKVKIETDPPGATVYLNAKEDGPVCTTPCTIDAPVGDTPIIVELENHQQLFENLVVPAKKPVSVKYKLMPSIGTLVVKGPSGARITVDDEDKGKAPTKFEVPAGPHTVKLFVDNKEIATEFVDVPANDEAVVDPKVKQTAETKTVATNDNEEDGGETNTTVGTSGTVEPTRTKDRGPYVRVALVMDVGFRNFSYSGDNLSANLPPEKEGGQVMLGPLIELYPGTMIGVRALRSFALVGRFGYGLNSQTVGQNNMMTSAKTFWRTFEISARQRFDIKQAVGLEVSAGFVRDQHQFEGERDDIELVPDADYQSVKLGARVSAITKTFEPYLTLENRIVLSGGPMAERFDGASAQGYRAALGVEAKLGAISARVEGAINYYVWSFEFDSSMDEFRADSGTDSIKLITVGLGYAY